MRGPSVALLLAGMLAGCSVVDTYNVNQNEKSPEQAAGTYYLAKQLVRVAVEQTTDTKTGVSSYNITTLTTAVPDTRYSMQLGFALSAFSNDDVKVEYKNGLLSRVAAIVVDRTSEIAIALAQDLGRLRAGEAPTVAGTTKTTTRIFEFDPFDADTARAVNQQIRQAVSTKNPKNYITCVEVEIHPGQWSPGCPANVSMALRGVTSVEQDPPNYDIVTLAKKPGIYFRRGMPRTMHVVLAGESIETKQMLFANNGPVYRVDVKRSAFVKRETEVVFTDGELTSVSVKKDSEVEAIAMLPVSIVNAYVGGVVDAFLQRQKIQDARAKYYVALTDRINKGVGVSQAKDNRDKYECLAAHPIDTTECD